MKKIINLALIGTIAPLSSFSICASNNWSYNNENMRPGDVFNVKVNTPPYFPCKVVTDVTQIVQTEDPQDTKIHVYIENDPIHEFYLDEIEIKSEGLAPEEEFSDYFAVDRWKGHNSAFEITVHPKFYFDVNADIEIIPTVKQSSFKVINENADQTKIVSSDAKMFSPYRTEIFPLVTSETVSNRITVKINEESLMPDQFNWNIIDDGAYGILTIKGDLINSNNISIDVKTDGEISTQQSLACRLSFDSSYVDLGIVPRCIPAENDKFDINLSNLFKLMPRFTANVGTIYYIDDQQALKPLENAKVTYDSDTQILHFDLSECTTFTERTNITIDFTNFRSVFSFADESWLDLDRWMNFAKNKNLDRLQFLKYIYAINDFLGQEKLVKWDNVDHKARIVAINQTALANNDKLKTEPSNEKALFTFEFENVLTHSDGSVVTHNWSNATAWYELDWGYNCWCIGHSDLYQSGIYKYLHGSEFLDKLDPNLKPLLKYNANHRITYTNRERGELCPVSQFWIRSLFFIPTAVEVAGPVDDFYFSENTHQFEESWKYVPINPWYDNQVEGTTSGKLSCRIKTAANSSTPYSYWICSPSLSGSGEANDEDTVFAKTDGSLSFTDMDNSRAIAPWFCI